MTKNSKSNPISFRLDTNLNNNFQKLYPWCLSRFLKNCVIRAVNSKEFFQEIYFNTDQGDQ